jgi:hypothetical protein
MAYVVSDLLEAPHRVRPSCGEQSEPFAAGVGPERVCFWARLRRRLRVSPHLKQHFLPCQFFFEPVGGKTARDGGTRSTASSNLSSDGDR